MRFIYEYKTKDNVRRSGEISASSRDDVYRELKKLGVKPSRVVLAPGLLNRIQSIGWRWAIIAVLAMLLLGLVVLLSGSKEQALEYKDKATAYSEKFEDKTRRQVIGDAAIIEKGIRTGWSFVFPEEGERFLASFAVPGVPAGQRTTNEQAIQTALARTVVVEKNDGIEARQIKSMVEGMKDELREFLNDGGSIKEYGDCLVKRQEEELGYYNRTKSELETLKNAGTPDAQLEALWEKRNAELRQMGIKLVPLPEE